MVEAGGVGIFRSLKTRKLLILRPAKNGQYYKIAPNWNVSGTRDLNFTMPAGAHGSMAAQVFASDAYPETFRRGIPTFFWLTSFMSTTISLGSPSESYCYTTPRCWPKL